MSLTAKTYGVPTGSTVDIEYGFAVLNMLFVFPPGATKFAVLVLYRSTDVTELALLYVPLDHVIESRYFTVVVENVFVALASGAVFCVGAGIIVATADVALT